MCRSGFLAGLGLPLFQRTDQHRFRQSLRSRFVPPGRCLPPGPEGLTLFAFVAAGADGDEVRSDILAALGLRHNVIEGQHPRFDAAIGAGAAEAGFNFGADMMFARSVVEIH